LSAAIHNQIGLPLVAAAKAADSGDLDFRTIRPAADQEPVRGGPRNNQDRQTDRRGLSQEAIINGPALLPRLLPGAVTVHLLPVKRRFAFPVTPSELGFVFSLPHLQVQNFLVEMIALFFGPSLTQLNPGVEQ
jgi:hypothetical protein